MHLDCRDILRHIQYYHGFMSNLRLWNVARTSSEIHDNMNKRLGLDSNLIMNLMVNDKVSDDTSDKVHDTVRNIDISVIKLSGTSLVPTYGPTLIDLPVLSCDCDVVMCDTCDIPIIVSDLPTLYAIE